MQKIKAVYTIVERNDKTTWVRIGWARENPDGSLRVDLDALPVKGTLEIREWTGTAP